MVSEIVCAIKVQSNQMTQVLMYCLFVNTNSLLNQHFCCSFGKNFKFLIDVDDDKPGTRSLSLRVCFAEEYFPFICTGNLKT